MTAHDSSSSAPSHRVLLFLAGLAAVASGWAVFLWRQLIEARAGGTPFCAFGETDCALLWDASFASAVHRMTGLPVAGWGLVWGLVALVLPLLAMRAADDKRDGWIAAIKLTAWAGLVGIAVLLVASAQAGLFCSSCAVTYLVSAAYGVLALVGVPVASGGLMQAATMVVAAWALLLVPGLRTPKNADAEATRVLARAAEAATATPTETAAPSPDTAAVPPPATDAEIVAFLGTLQPPLLQGISDSLEIMRRGPAFPAETPRAPVYGNPNAPVLITEFADIKCSHCAALHGNLHYLLETLPGRFAVDARHYPLDGNCNPQIPARGPETVRCMAARILVCMEDDPARFDLAARMFESQRALTPELAASLASPYLPATALDACLADPATQSHIDDDVTYATRYDPHGTPIVLVNGRLATSFGAFLYAIILAGGDPDHPAFATLPPPQPPQEHVH